MRNTVMTAIALFVVPLTACGARTTITTGTTPTPPAAPVTTIVYPPGPSGTESVPDPKPPEVPAGRVTNEGLVQSGTVRVSTDGRQLFVTVLAESDCMRDEARLLREQDDVVEVEVKTVSFPPPNLPTNTTGAYTCGGMTWENVFAVLDLRKPLGERRVIVRRLR